VNLYYTLKDEHRVTLKF